MFLSVKFNFTEYKTARALIEIPEGMSKKEFLAKVEEDNLSPCDVVLGGFYDYVGIVSVEEELVDLSCEDQFMSITEVQENKENKEGSAQLYFIADIIADFGKMEESAILKSVARGEQPIERAREVAERCREMFMDNIAARILTAIRLIEKEER